MLSAYEELAPEKPYLVDWPITRRCNLDCLHCRGMPSDELSTAEAKKLIEEIALLNGLGVRVMISIDGATAETYEHIRRGADFEGVLTAVRRCVQEELLAAHRAVPAF